jgi:hypothetical protein
MTLTIYNNAGLSLSAAVMSSYTTLNISAAGNTGTVSTALSGGNLFVEWTGLRTAGGILTIPTWTGSGNEMLIFDQANNAGQFPITAVPVSGAVIGVPIISRNRGLLRLLDAQSLSSWLVVG